MPSLAHIIVEPEKRDGQNSLWNNIGNMAAPVVQEATPPPRWCNDRSGIKSHATSPSFTVSATDGDSWPTTTLFQKSSGGLARRTRQLVSRRRLAMQWRITSRMHTFFHKRSCLPEQGETETEPGAPTVFEYALGAPAAQRMVFGLTALPTQNLMCKSWFSHVLHGAHLGEGAAAARGWWE